MSACGDKSALQSRIALPGKDRRLQMYNTNIT
jgi:hypothetical protein